LPELEREVAAMTAKEAAKKIMTEKVWREEAEKMIGNAIEKMKMQG